MNDYQLNLYNGLMSLCANSEKKTFYFADCELDGSIFRIFNYRIASYTEFLAPYALDCRGMMFELDEYTGEPIRLASHTMPKFFNDSENPSTMDLDYSNPKQIMLKKDGSLMSTFFHNDKLYLKSKGSVTSTQCVDSMELLKAEPFLRAILKELTEIKGYTVNLEYCAPTNRIVIGYMEPELTILNAINRYTGEVVDLKSKYPMAEPYMVEDFVTPNMTHDEVVSKYVNLDGLTGIEGYVIRLNSGQCVKCKCEWYLQRHASREKISTPKGIYELILQEAIDDARTLMGDDQLILSQIEEIEEWVTTIYNQLVDKVTHFYDTNKDLDRKSYAILGQNTFNSAQFSLVMSMYLNKDVDFKTHMIKYYDYYCQYHESQSLSHIE